MVTPRHASAAPPAPATHPVFNNAVGGVLCLDFVNTTGGWQPADDHDRTLHPRDVVRSERLTTYDRLVEWARWIGAMGGDSAREAVARGRRNRRAAAGVLRRAIRLRAAIYGLGRAVAEQRAPAPDDLDLLNQEVQAGRRHEQLIAVGGRTGTRHYAVAFDDPAALDAMLWAVALSAADLFASDRVRRIGRCPASTCGWLFLDTSRSGRRHWCDMAVCGNADKVRRFRERQRARDTSRRADANF